MVSNTETDRDRYGEAVKHIALYLLVGGYAVYKVRWIIIGLIGGLVVAWMAIQNPEPFVNGALFFGGLVLGGLAVAAGLAGLGYALLRKGINPIEEVP